jgi:hypothetical protein
MTSAPAGQILEVSAKRCRQSRQDQNRRVPAAAFNTAEIGLMHVRSMGEFLLREPALASEALQIEADSDPHIHGCMAGIGLTLAHRL